MSKNSEQYIKMSCPNCESEYAVEFYFDTTDGEPLYCPFCGELIPEADEDEEDEREDGESWKPEWE